MTGHFIEQPCGGHDVWGRISRLVGQDGFRVDEVAEGLDEMSVEEWWWWWSWCASEARLTKLKPCKRLSPHTGPQGELGLGGWLVGGDGDDVQLSIVGFLAPRATTQCRCESDAALSRGGRWDYMSDLMPS